MFKRLLSNLPFNPGLFDQVNFYAARLRADASVRRVGFIFIALAFAVQLVAAMYPAEKSLATSPNDILDGLTTKSSILKAWDNNTGNVRAIYRKFGISRENIAAIPSEQPNYTIKSTDRNWWSIGRQPLSNFGISSKDWGERSINAEGNTVYQRPLKAWDNKTQASTYKAWHGVNSQGKDFWIMQTCGNATFDGPYLPAPPTPKLTVHKTLLSGSTAKAGDTVKFRLEYQNTMPDSLASGFKLTDTLNSNLEFVSLGYLASRSGQSLTITNGGSLGYSANATVTTLVAKVKSSAKAGTQVCNYATVDSDQTSPVQSEKPCLTVVSTPTPSPSPSPGPHSPTPPAPSPAPHAPSPPPTAPNAPSPPPSKPDCYCSTSVAFVNGSNKDFTVKTSVYTSGLSATKYKFNYDIDENGTIDFSETTTSTTSQHTFSGLAAGTHTIAIQVDAIHSSGEVYHSNKCHAQVTVAEDARVLLTKTVKNLTSGKADANGTTVKSGDQLEFRLTTENVTATDYVNYKGQDYFGSVLQYADITNAQQLAEQGINITPDQNLVWTSAKIKAHSSEVKVIKVKVKDLVPATNSPSKVSPDYNCKINNAYGNEVTMNVECPVVKQASVAAANLPNTGSGTSVMIGALAVSVAGYLFARSRLMARELEIVKVNHVSVGGM